MDSDCATGQTCCSGKCGNSCCTASQTAGAGSDCCTGLTYSQGACYIPDNSSQSCGGNSAECLSDNCVGTTCDCQAILGSCFGQACCNGNSCEGAPGSAICCEATGTSCTTATQGNCCSGVCSGQQKCYPSVLGGRCLNAQDCLNYPTATCPNGVCCYPNGTNCGSNSVCCSGKCSSGVCSS
jgi:hypothetical protein